MILFPPLFFSILVQGAIVLAAIGIIVLLILFVKDVLQGRLW